MIKVALTNSILKQISAIDENKFSLSTIALPSITHNRLKKNSRKKSSYASNKIEGNPLSEAQADRVIDDDPHRHFLRPEQEIRNYYAALQFLDEKLKDRTPFSRELVLAVQAIAEQGASKEKIGLRGAMPPGYLFAVYDSDSGNAEYIPPEYSDIPGLLDELTDYVHTTDDHPLIMAAVVHYQLVTIHPFEDGNGRTARLISGYILDYYGYGFQGIGSLEEYFAYDSEEYYSSLQMGLPALYYDGRDNPPHPEIWIEYFLRMVRLYSERVYEISRNSGQEAVLTGLSHLKAKEKALLKLLIENNKYEFTPVEASRLAGVTNKTIINRCVRLTANGFIVPVITGERIRSYRLSDFTKLNSEEIIKIITTP